MVKILLIFTFTGGLGVFAAAQRLENTQDRTRKIEIIFYA
jgi:hypothetical protein